MHRHYQSGLGELLRHLLELVDTAASGVYQSKRLPYRPRYTPIMRVLAAGPQTVKEITETLMITQGAVSQSIKLMEKDLLIERQSSSDARQTIIALSQFGQSLLETLDKHWQATFLAIERLEKELGFALMEQLMTTISALQKEDFALRIQHAKQDLNHQAQIKTKQQAEAAQHFQSGAEDYAQYRPSYPKQLVASLAKLAPGKKLALDIGAGSGQLSILLAEHFQQVIATDISQKQLENAVSHDKIVYKNEAAEKISVDDHCADLIVAAQAAHWFDLEKFYAEVKRVAYPNTVIALISYGVPYLESRVNTPFQQFYWQKVAPFWPSQRKHVENGYSQLPFPFKPLKTPEYFIYRDWDLEQLLGYLGTWSASRKAIQSGNHKLLVDFQQAICRQWGDKKNKHRITWPISMRLGQL